MAATKDFIDSQVEENSANHPNHGLVQVADKTKPDALDSMAYEVLDDTMYNIIEELLLGTYREEKIARCNTAAILLEQKARDEVEVEDFDKFNEAAGKASFRTDLAYFDPDGLTSLDHKASHALPNGQEVRMSDLPPDTTVINIMEEVTEVYCKRCKLPEFPYPTEGEGSRRPEPGKEYCKKRVYVKNYPFDIYGNHYAADKKGVGKGNGKKKKLEAVKESTPTGSQDSPNGTPPANEVHKKEVPYPTVKCPLECGKSFPIQRIAAHYSREHGNGHRRANREAKLKMSNANGYGSGSSRNGTPTPSGNPKDRSSPKKRGADEMDEDESPPQKKTKLDHKKSQLKAPSMTKTSSQMSSSNLNHVETQLSDDDYDDGDDQHDDDFSGDPRMKKKPLPKPAKKKPMRTDDDSSWEHRPKKAAKSIGSKKPGPLVASESRPQKIKLDLNGTTKIKIKQNGPREKSDSSHTLSSPNA